MVVNFIHLFTRRYHFLVILSTRYFCTIFTQVYMSKRCSSAVTQTETERLSVCLSTDFCSVATDIKRTCSVNNIVSDCLATKIAYALCKNYTNTVLPTNNEEIIFSLVDARSLGSDVSFSDNHFAQSTLEVLATPFWRKLTFVAWTTAAVQECSLYT